MKPVTFFRIALLVPLVLPLLLLPLDMNAVVGLLLASLWFGGVQYLVFAVAFYLWIGKVKDPERIRRASFFAPLVFIPVQWAGWLIYSYVDELSNPHLMGIWGALLPFATYCLVIGYAYVGVVNLLYFVVFGRRPNAVEP